MPTLLRQVLFVACRPSTKVAESKKVIYWTHQVLQLKAGHSSRNTLSSKNWLGETFG